MKWLDRRLIDNPFYLGLCRNEKDFHAALKRLKVPRDKWPAFLGSARANATAHYFRNPEGKVMAIICIGSARGRTKLETYAILVHEAVHVWQWIRDDIGEKEPSNEFEAYSIQRLALTLMAAYDGS